MTPLKWIRIEITPVTGRNWRRLYPENYDFKPIDYFGVTDKDAALFPNEIVQALNAGIQYPMGCRIDAIKDQRRKKMW